MSEFGLSAEDADTLVEEKATAEFYEELSNGRDKKLAANWVITELLVPSTSQELD